jgi:exodeoxyribonuclease V gamma subunit
LKRTPFRTHPDGVPGFHLHRSNRLESLAGALAEQLRVPLHSPLAAETVLVQSQGMARWLKLELARRLGVAANVEFPFPRAFAHGLFRALGFTVDARPSFDPALLVWRLHALLPVVAAEPGFTAVARFLADGDERKRFQLAGRLARLFDQYMVYRPELLLAWDADDETWAVQFAAPAEDEWQARLWHRVATGWATGHPARWQRNFLERAQAGTLPAGALPERVSVFGISALPPFHLELLAALSTVTQVDLFLLQPTEHFWGDLRSRREQAMARRPDDPGVRPEEGHPLVASWGRTGREMHGLLLVHDVQDAPEHFAEPAGGTLLGGLQAAMNALQCRPEGGSRTQLAKTDDSLRVHSCHSPQREVEVLRDHLLAWFQDEPELQPRDVVVMVPDLDTYAPLLEAVLGQPERPEHALPFTLADRPPRAGGIGAALEHALELAAGDFAAPDVFALLERPVVRLRFGLDDDALARCRDWIRAAEIRWGRDARQAATRSAAAGHTWRAGLDRLLLSFAVGGAEEVMACGIARSVAVDGADAETLGGLCQFAGTLLDFACEAETPVSPAQWEARLKTLLTALCVTKGDFLREAEAVNTALATLGDAEKWGRCEEPLSLAVVREHLDQVLGEDRRGSGFLTGGITVCGLRPMRSVPFEIVCVLGLNHGTFPRQHSPLTFDLTARQRRPGDSSPRDDDRYLFLETLLSARRRLHLSHVGQSQRDGKDIPPSVVIGELLDHLDHEFSLPDGRPPSAELVVKHRLQAFSPEYFRDRALFSFSPANFAAAVALQRSRQQPPPALAGELSLPAADSGEPVELTDLVRFFRNPARFFAERRLGLRFRRDDEPLAREESFRVDTRDNFRLVEAGVAVLRRSGSLRELQELQAEAGRIPGGTLTAGETRRLERETAEFWQRCEPYLRGEVREVSGVVALAAAVPALNGRTELIAGQLARARYSKLASRPEVMLDVWLELLFAAARDSTVTQAVLIGRDQTWRLTAPENSRALLADLVGLFLRGQTRVLPFAPKTSWAYIEKLLGRVRDEAEREASAREAARKVWAPEFTSDWAPDPESADEAMELAFSGADLIAEPEFAALSRTVFEPLLANRKEVA